MEDRLILGLGNPGREYMETRHNAGFLLVDGLLDRFGAEEEKAGPSYLLWSAETRDTRVFFMKPMTFMNASGLALASFLQQHPLDLQHLLVVYDDVALSLGSIRIRPSGSAGGQKGMRHILQLLATREVPRLRIGIDSEARGSQSLSDFVLDRFCAEEVPIFERARARAEEAAVCWLREPFPALMARFNTRDVIPDPINEPINKLEENVE